MKEYATQRVTTRDDLRLVLKDFGVKAVKWLELNSEIINPRFIEENLNDFNLNVKDILRLFISTSIVEKSALQLMV